MAGVLTELFVAARLAGRTIGKRLRSELQATPDVQGFRAEMEAILATLGPDIVRRATWVECSGGQPAWQGSGVELTKGDDVSYFAEGCIYANKHLDIRLDTSTQLWSRLGADGDIFRSTRPSYTFTADRAGELYFGQYFPNDWADRQGNRVHEDKIYDSLSGALLVLVIQWACPARAGLECLSTSAGNPPARINAELQRLDQGDITPPGWHNLWHLGPSEIYRHTSDDTGHDCIHCHTNGNVAILQKDVDLPLEASSEISWRWCVDQLPSDIREDSVPSHDYLSIAVEFDNGRDITYYWSSSLAEGTGYDCPLPNWKGKEYHVVVRSGEAGLGQWLQERRNLYTDYAHYMGEPPARIVKVWLIANSLFQRGTGRCDYADIILQGSSAELRAL